MSSLVASAAEHAAFTDSTALYPGAGQGVTSALAYVALGVAGESSEVLEKELDGDLEGVQAELGDVAWYLARLHVELGVEVPEPGAAVDASPARLVIAAGRVAELTKKALRDDAGELTPQRRCALLAQVEVLRTAWVGVHGALGLDPVATLAGNAAKLGSRLERGVIQGSGDNR